MRINKTFNPLATASLETTFDIPIYFSSKLSIPYIEQLKLKFKNVIDFFQSCKEENYYPAIKKNVIKKISDIQYAILKTITEYLNGHPSKSFELLSWLIHEYELDSDLISQQQVHIPAGTLLFRIKRDYSKRKNNFIKAGISKTNPFDLFHPPLQRRRSIGTNRFSIPGYPCLYVSQSLLGAYSECFPPGNSFGAFDAICFKNIRPLYFLDLSENQFLGNKELFEGIGATNENDILGSIYAYQLIIAAHTKICYPIKERIFFKPEYIVPQLILQWLKLNGLSTIDGIYYKSCATPFLLNKSSNYNYILPVKKNLRQGFCPTLASLFYASNIYHYPYHTKPTNKDDLLNEIFHELINSSFKSLCI